MPSPFDPELRTYEEDRAIHGSFPLKLQLLMRAKTVVKKAIATGVPAQPVDEPYLVVPILGQSNASGSGLEAPGVTTPPPHPRVHQWPGCGRHKGRVLEAREPLLHEVPGGGVGFATTFGAQLAEETGKPVLLVPTARGDTRQPVPVRLSTDRLGAGVHRSTDHRDPVAPGRVRRAPDPRR